MCNDFEIFQGLKSLGKEKHEVKVGDGYCLKVEGEGNIKLNVKGSNGVLKKCKLFNVLYVPDLSYNLISVSKMIEGINREFTIKKTPEQNGVAERMNRTIQETMRSMLSESGLPKRFWAEALSTAIYLRNRSPTKAVIGMTPLESWSGKKPNVEHLRVFGCLCYAHIPKDERKKLDSKAREAVFMGYGMERKGYRLYDMNLRKIFFSRDVLFNESKFVNSLRNKEEAKEIINIKPINGIVLNNNLNDERIRNKST